MEWYCVMYPTKLWKRLLIWGMNKLINPLWSSEVWSRILSKKKKQRKNELLIKIVLSEASVSMKIQQLFLQL